jgi:PII-like signaling protein
MEPMTKATLLRIFVGESDRHHHRPVYEVVVERARAAHLAGATVLRGPMGFGHSSRLHTSKILELSKDMSIVIEVVDKPEKIDAFLPQLDALLKESGASVLVTVEQVQVLAYGAKRSQD